MHRRIVQLHDTSHRQCPLPTTGARATQKPNAQRKTENRKQAVARAPPIHTKETTPCLDFAADFGEWVSLERTRHSASRPHHRNDIPHTCLMSRRPLIDVVHTSTTRSSWFLVLFTAVAERSVGLLTHAAEAAHPSRQDLDAIVARG